MATYSGKIVSGSNESLLSVYDHLDDNTRNNMTSNTGDSQQFAAMLQQLYSSMSDNQSSYNFPSRSSLSSSSIRKFPASSNDLNSYILSVVSLWFVLLVNPIVILFGVIGNLLATYILIKGNIAKLPVSFYTIMLNISDTLNLLIPVFIFWLDNLFNRTPERVYFRDRSNFLCKVLMCPDQLFAALSAWYMCAISFNRWCSVCRPSTYFFHTTASVSKASSSGSNNVNNKINYGQKKDLFGTPTSSSTWFPFEYRCCMMRNIKYRQHLRAFRSIGIITLIGILCCLYPIFMHELRPVMSIKPHDFDVLETDSNDRDHSKQWTRCYYSTKHEYAYDIIGIILTSFLHILPLTSVAVMNIMIIVRLRKRQRLMAVSTNSARSVLLNKKKKKASLKELQKHFTYKLNSSSIKEMKQTNMIISPSTPSLVVTHKDQATLTDSPANSIKLKTTQVSLGSSGNAPRRHQSRDRTITIMLVSVALSYIILTLPYRLFWSYNVYIKRMYPEKLKSEAYLSRMHYIDHVLRTIRNIHYGTNFIFFIFLSKPFRRKFRQLFIDRFRHNKTDQFDDQSMNTFTTNNYNPNKINNVQNIPAILELINEKNHKQNHVIKTERSTRTSNHETPSLIDDARIQEDELCSIIELELERNELLDELK
ncbi:unnamed protein product [Adineta steineri]|uniref:G-protein coupled receptors family 1 profile domain-containing protein n=1 Tax=Adineta steineri TaxID=433720 RepID=A0A813WB12_9BILA|nr:unnamed protein product [Adineta steineri]CAF3878290.1 unnamed protein product [Adineta steineri]